MGFTPALGTTFFGVSKIPTEFTGCLFLSTLSLSLSSSPLSLFARSLAHFSHWFSCSCSLSRTQRRKSLARSLSGQIRARGCRLTGVFSWERNTDLEPPGIVASECARESEMTQAVPHDSAAMETTVVLIAACR